MLRIGLGYHGVIIEKSRLPRSADQLLETPIASERAHAGMFDAVAQLVAASGGNVWIVSKAGVQMEKAVRGWLEQERFFERTGMADDHLLFCREREGKALICKGLGITHFVDDRIHLMQILRNAVPHLFLFGERDRSRFCPPWAHYVSSWHDVVRGVLRDHVSFSQSDLPISILTTLNGTET